jgi:SOS-response transcriptional repressor LexA
MLHALDAIRAFHARHRVSPTIEELATLLGKRGKSGAHRIVCRLVESGHLVRVPGRRRNYVPVNPDLDLSRVPSRALRAELARRGTLRG